jgi:hypothetical protein
MIYVDFFSNSCCKGTELLEGWYWYQDDSEDVGGPYENQHAAIEAAEKGTGWAHPYWE